METLIATLGRYLQYPFVRHAVLAGLLISLCAALLGTTVISRHISYLGDSLSHVAFGAAAVAAACGLFRSLPFVLTVTVVCAVFLFRTGQRGGMQGDAATAVLTVSAMAIGYLLLHVFGNRGNLSGDVTATLFGATKLLTASAADVRLCVGLSVSVLAAFLVLHNAIFAVSFDEEFARATGLPTEGLNLLLAAVSGVTVVLAMKLVGALLISALILLPALSAMRIVRSHLAVLLVAAGLSAGCTVIGLLGSMLASTPVGPSIVAADLFVCLLCRLAGGPKKPNG